MIRKTMDTGYTKDLQYYKFCAYGFLKDLRFFDPFMILFLAEKGLSFTQIGLLYAIREITTNILEIPTGLIADALGRRRTMIFSLAAYTVSFIIFYLSSGFTVFIVAMGLFSIGEAFRTGTHKAMIFEHLAIHGWLDHKIDYYGHTRAWSQNGSAISSLLGAAIVFTSGNYASIFLFSTIPYILNLLLMTTYPENLDGPITRHNPGSLRQKFIAVKDGLVLSFSRHGMFRAITNASMHDAFHKAAKDFLQPVLNTFALALPVFIYLDDQRRAALVIGVVYFFIYILTSRASRNSQVVARRFKTQGDALNFTILTGFGCGTLAGLCYTQGITWAAITFFTLIYIIQNLRAPIEVAYVSETAQNEILATALSLRSQISAAFAAIIAVCIGVLTDRYGLGPALTTVSVFLGLSAPLYLNRDPGKVI